MIDLQEALNDAVRAWVASPTIDNADVLADALDAMTNALALPDAQPVAWQPAFDAMSPSQEALVVELCAEIAGEKGCMGNLPDPVRLLEMAQELYEAERDDFCKPQPAAAPESKPDDWPSELTAQHIDRLQTALSDLGPGTKKAVSWLCALAKKQLEQPAAALEPVRLTDDEASDATQASRAGVWVFLTRKK